MTVSMYDSISMLFESRLLLYVVTMNTDSMKLSMSYVADHSTVLDT